MYRVNTISELHSIIGFGQPGHPLVTVIDYSKVNVADPPEADSFIMEFFSVNFKKHCSLFYGRQHFDHQEGTLLCTAPGQIISYNKDVDNPGSEGWGLYFHPELIRHTMLGKKIHEYSFFTYAENEALHLSSDEQQTLLLIVRQLEFECNTNIDHFSNGLILSNIELLLNYCNRFYGRQFITRTSLNKDVVVRFETYVKSRIWSPGLEHSGLPTVKQCADEMCLSPNYLSDLLKSETGKGTQEHIHFFLLDRAMTMLSSQGKTVNEIAYELGFQHPQSFSKLFRKKTGVTPGEYRSRTSKN
jgi:AraC-like DNA-binding protein